MLLLAQEVLHICGTISHEHPLEIMPDLHLYRDPEEIAKEEQTRLKKLWPGKCQSEWSTLVPQLIAAQSEVDTGLMLYRGRRACLIVPAVEDWPAAPLAQASEWVGATRELFCKPLSKRKEDGWEINTFFKKGNWGGKQKLFNTQSTKWAVLQGKSAALVRNRPKLGPGVFCGRALAGQIPS